MKKFKLSENITTNRLILRRRSHNDDEQMWQAIDESREFIREYLAWVDDTKSFDDVVKASDMFHDEWETDKEWCYDIFDKNDRLVGCIGVHRISFLNQSAEFGYWLRQSETHKGYMTEAVLNLERALFEAGIHRIEICCDINNTASANVAKRAGYMFEGTAKEALYHYSGLHDKMIFFKLSPYPVKDL